MAVITITDPIAGGGPDPLRLVRLLQLVSPSLPTGAFSYSQGIEWAVESGWIRDAAGLDAWLRGQLDGVLARVDGPLLARLYRAARDLDEDGFEHWGQIVLASRESAELRAEEQARGRALADLLVALGLPAAAGWRSLIAGSQLAGFAFAAASWSIPIGEAATGYCWSWLENQVLAGVKLVPLGQTQGQALLLALGERIPAVVETGLSLADDGIGASLPALAIASAAHETQYTRLFRS